MENVLFPNFRGPTKLVEFHVERLIKAHGNLHIPLSRVEGEEPSKLTDGSTPRPLIRRDNPSC